MVAVHGAAPAYPIGETLLPSQGLNGAAKDSLGNSFEPYYGGPEAHEICWWMTQLTLGNNPIEEERKQRIGLYEDDAENYGFVTELDDDRLNAITSSSTDPRFWLLDIYSDRCPRCQSLAPQMIAIGKHFKKTLVSAGSFGKKGSVGARVKVAALNTRVWYNATEELTGPVLPWLALFHKGYKIAEMPGEDIQGVVSTRVPAHRSRDGFGFARNPRVGFAGCLGRRPASLAVAKTRT
ncbi:hypothetical protein M885DRAFT_295670 [Pelagophyceae sp. CCMP2097]|nr:hypothetical protein M885DRAFT_295670 [Pelagophyceae sp. CCMP2097]